MKGLPCSRSEDHSLFVFIAVRAFPVYNGLMGILRPSHGLYTPATNAVKEERMTYDYWG
jgi:hypothetical protein